MLRGLITVMSLASAAMVGAQPAVPPAELSPAPAGILSAAGERFLRAHVEGGVDAELRWSDFRDLGPELERFYGDRGWTPASRT